MAKWKKTKVPSGTWMERDMFESKAYHSLTGWAPQLLTIFLSKRRFENSGRTGREKRILLNRNNITMTEIEVKRRFGVTQPRLTRAIDGLLAKGFITLIHHGGAYKQDKSIYGLSDKWMFWQPGMTLECRPDDGVKRGWQK